MLRRSCEPVDDSIYCVMLRTIGDGALDHCTSREISRVEVGRRIAIVFGHLYLRFSVSRRAKNCATYSHAVAMSHHHRVFCVPPCCVPNRTRSLLPTELVTRSVWDTTRWHAKNPVMVRHCNR